MAHGEDRRAIREYIAEHPNSRSASIAADLGLDPKIVSGHINGLSNEGVIVGFRGRSESCKRWRLASWHR